MKECKLKFKNLLVYEDDMEVITKLSKEQNISKTQVIQMLVKEHICKDEDEVVAKMVEEPEKHILKHGVDIIEMKLKLGGLNMRLRL